MAHYDRAPSTRGNQVRLAADVSERVQGDLAAGLGKSLSEVVDVILRRHYRTLDGDIVIEAPEEAVPVMPSLSGPSRVYRPTRKLG